MDGAIPSTRIDSPCQARLPFLLTWLCFHERASLARSKARESMFVRFFRTAPPLSFEEVPPKSHPGGNPFHSGPRTPSTMDTMGGLFSPDPADQEPEPPTSFAPKPPRPNGRIPLGRGLPPGRFRSSVPSTLKTVLSRLGIHASTDPDAVHRAIEIHEGCLAFLTQIRTDSNYLKTNVKNEPACAALLASFDESTAKIFTLAESDYQSMRRIFRILAQKYHSDSRFPGSTPNPVVFTVLSTAWTQIKEFYSWA